MLTWCAPPVHLLRAARTRSTCRWRGAGRSSSLTPSALTLEQQIELHDWLNAGRGGVQIVSITSQADLAAGGAGGFLEGLFYRLNVVTLEASRDGM